MDEHADDSDHGDATVLALYRTATLEGLGLGLEPSERVKDTEGVGDSDLKLVNIKRRWLEGRVKGKGELGVT